MSWDDIMRRMLPPIGAVQPHITGPAGTFGAGEAEGRGPHSSRPHNGVDVNYVGGQNVLNKSHPVLHAPVDGEVIFIGGRSGTISIKDGKGFVHKLMHTASQNVRVGDRITAGDSIGTVGNKGTHDYHLHYQLEDSEGGLVNPPAFWNRENQTTPVPSKPPHLDEFQLATQIMSGGNANSAPSALPPDNPGDRFYNPFGRLSSAPAGVAPSFADRFTKWGSVPQGNGSPAASDAPATFANRFGNWGLAPAGSFGDTNSPVLRALQQNRRSEIPDGLAPTSARAASSALPFQPDGTGTGGVLGKYFDPSLISPAQGASPWGRTLSGPTGPDLPAHETGLANDAPVRILGRRVVNPSPVSAYDAAVATVPGREDSFGNRFGNWMSSPAGVAPLVPNQPAPLSPVLGIFSGKPMPDYPVPPPIWGLTDGFRAPGDDDENWYARWRQLISSE